MENLKVIIHSRVFDIVLILFHFGVSVDFDAKVVSALLPVDLAVSDGEEVFGADFRAVWYFEKGYASWYVLVFGYPVG